MVDLRVKNEMYLNDINTPILWTKRVVMDMMGEWEPHVIRLWDKKYVLGWNCESWECAWEIIDITEQFIPYIIFLISVD